MSEIKSFKDLLVWQKGLNIVEEIYELTNSFPSLEKFGLFQQLRRASISVPSNIAEGWGRKHPKSFSNFIKIARGSLFEISTQIEIAKRLCYLNEEKCKRIDEFIDHEGKMLNKLIQSIDNNIKECRESESPYGTTIHNSRLTNNYELPLSTLLKTKNYEL